ncbi:MAG: hypothetical protein JST36_10725 [Bacteroidetes bacterium]|nr:hypothetical protein [Bacteroidota bacterium]
MAKPISISIIKIREEEFILKTEGIKKINPKKLQIGFQLDFDWKLEADRLMLSTTVFYQYNANNTAFDISKFTLLMGFEVKNLKQILTLSDDVFEIDDDYLLTFVGAAISSARGMLAFKHSGTILENFYVPLVDPRNFIENINRQVPQKAPKQIISPKKSSVKTTTKPTS